MKTTTFASFSFGCRVNEAEREFIDSKLIKLGFKHNLTKPDICIINTCAVTHKAEREAKKLIYKLNKNFPKAKIIITGCAATYWNKFKLNTKLPKYLTISNNDKQYIPNIILNHLKQNTPKVHKNHLELLSNSKFKCSGRLLVKIQDGCHRFCSYCIVPYLRGLPKSYTISNIIKNIQSNKKGIKEIILTAINTEAFGYDTKEHFIDLIRDIINQTNIKRISFGSIHPWSINQRFIDFYKTCFPKKRIVNFFHIPIQSGSDKILKYMKRDYTTHEINNKINAIYKINPNASIATDIITGFLGETKKDFKDTYNFLKKSKISKFHVFRYSTRKNTAAYFMKDQIKEPSEQQKKQRSQILRKLGEEKYNKFLKKLINYSCNALFIDKRTDNYQYALLDNQVLVLVKTKDNLKGEIKKIKVEDYKKNKLFGKIVL